MKDKEMRTAVQYDNFIVFCSVTSLRCVVVSCVLFCCRVERRGGEGGEGREMKNKVRL